MNAFIYPFIYPFVYPFIYRFIYSSFYPFTRAAVLLSVYHFLCTFIRFFFLQTCTQPYIRSSIHSSVRSSVRPSIRPSIFLCIYSCLQFSKCHEIYRIAVTAVALRPSFSLSDRICGHNQNHTFILRFFFRESGQTLRGGEDHPHLFTLVCYTCTMLHIYPC